MASSLRSIPRLRPYGRTSSSSAGFSFPKPTVYGPSSNTPSLQQLLRLEYEKGQKHPHRSILGKGLHAAGHGLESALDIIARPSYGIAEGVRESLDKHPGDFWDGFKQGISGKKKTGFGQVLAEHSKFFRQHKVLRALSGIGLDIATDPTNLLLIAAAPETGGTSLTPLIERGFSKEAAKGLMETSRTLRSGRISKEAALAAEGKFAAADKSLVDAGKEPMWGAHQDLAKHTYRRMAADQAGQKLADPLTAMASHHFSGAQALAQGEYKAALGDRRLGAHVILPFGQKYAKRGSVGVALPFTRAPSLERISRGAGILGKFPKHKEIADLVGKAFKPGFGHAKYHAMERLSIRTGEQLHNQYVKEMEAVVAPAARKLSKDEQIDALDKAVTEKGLVTTKARVLNELKLDKMVRDGKITQKQADFIRGWHNFTEYLRARDRDFETPYKSMKGVEGTIYVPHIYTRQGTLPQFGKGPLTIQGFQHERALQEGSAGRLEALKELHTKGIYKKEIETDPMTLLSIRAHRGSTAHANSIMQHVAAATEGVVTRIPNMEKLAQLSKDKRVLLKKQSELKTYDEMAAEVRAEAEAWRNHKVAKATAKHEAQLKAREQAIKRVQKRKERAGKKRAPVLPTHSALIKKKPEELKAIDEALSKATGRKANFARNIVARHRRLQAYSRKLQKLRGPGKYGAKVHGSEAKAEFENLIKEFKLKDAAPLLTKKMGKVATADGLRAETWVDRLDHQISELRRENVAKWDEFRGKLGISKGSVPFSAHIAQQRGAKARQLERHENLLADLNHKAEQRVAKAMGKVDQKFAVQERLGQSYQRRLDKIERGLVRHQTSKFNPEVAKRNLEEVERLKDPETGSPIAVTPEVKQGLERISRISSDDELQLEFGNQWGKFIGRWKVWATVMNPGYRVRNTLSDMWNAYISGMPMWAIPTYGGKAMSLMVAIKKGNPQALRTYLEAYDHGILSGLFQGDVERVAKYLKGERTNAGLLKSGKELQLVQKLATDFNRNAENLGRLAHYLYRRDYEKMGPAAAAEKVRAAHFDYEDLTPSERRLKGSLIPFYTWTRKNIPYQITQLVSRPGRYSAVSKMMNEFNQASGTGQGPTPAWLKQQLAFHVPFGGKGNLMMTQFGPIDIEKLQHPTQLLGMITPPVKMAAELAANKSLLTGAPIYGKDTVHPRAPIGGLAAAILSNIPGSNVGQTARNVRGKTVTGPGANPLFSYFAGQVPLANQFVTGRSNIKQAQRGGKVGPFGGAALSEIGGISTYQPDPEAEITARKSDLEKGFKQYIKGLRDEGVLKQTKRKKKSAYDKSLEQLLTGG